MSAASATAAAKTPKFITTFTSFDRGPRSLDSKEGNHCRSITRMDSVFDSASKLFRETKKKITVILLK